MAELIEALQRFITLPALDRAAQSPSLIEATKAVMAAERSTAMIEATNPATAGHLSHGELARRLGVTKPLIGKTIARVPVAFAMRDETGRWYGDPNLPVTESWDYPLTGRFKPADVYNPLHRQLLILRCAALPEDQTVTPYAAHVRAEDSREFAVRVTEQVRDAMFGPPITGTPERIAWERRRDQRKRDLDGED
ncbi:hypothetical protein [Amycolatopsis sp. NPDC058986]|uniref:hypothetical protein n=1 Tax=Amycolatopsis sp. NPDC058986 TaxID=3346685 RepID=UPI00366A95BD